MDEPDEGEVRPEAVAPGEPEDVAGTWVPAAEAGHGAPAAAEAPAAPADFDAPDGAAPTADVPVVEPPAVFAGPAVPAAQGWQPPGGDVVRAESPMPLSMPPFAAPAPGSAGPSRGDGGTSDPAGGAGTTPPEPPYPPPAVPYGSFPPPPPPAPPHHGRRVVVVAAVAALLAGGLGAGLGVALGGSSTPGAAPGKVPLVPSPGRSTQASSGPKESTAAIVKAVEPAIVDISTNVASAVSQGQTQAEGTGMIITSSGEVLTNNHVVEDATKISVSIQGRTGSFAASVIGVDPSKDVALLQIEGVSGSLPTVTLGDSSAVAVGDPVVAMGNAQGLGGQPTTVTGIVSALGRTITASDSASGASEVLHGLIETDAPIQPGDSGGPLVNGRAQVVGMDTAALTSSNVSSTLGFAIPIDQARTIAQAMEKGKATGGVVLGESPFLGIFEQPNGGVASGGFGTGLGPSGSSGAPVSGVTLYDVAIGGPAQAAGLAAGDTITAVGSTHTATFGELQQAIAAHEPGDQVQVTYVDTSGTTHTVSVTLAGIPK